MATEISEILVGMGKLSDVDLQRAVRLQHESGESLEGILSKLGLVSERDLAEALSTHHNVPLAENGDYPEVSPLDKEISPKFLKESQVIPLAEDENNISVAMVDPGNEYVVHALQLVSGKDVAIRVGLPSDVESAFERLFGSGQSAMGQIVESIGGSEDIGDEDDIDHLRDLASEAPVVRLVNLTISRAVESRASDIHIEPFESRLKVRYRVDGVVREVESPPARLASAVISRIKLMAKLNIAERRLPQDGRIQLRVQGKTIDLRVSTVPTMYGESVVMRILDKQSLVLDFESVGFRHEMLEQFREVLHMPHGIMLVTGPTGSGKTTTLYTALQELNTPDRKILTVEDPVEYQIEGINQIQVKPQIDLTFASALRAIVRQDPDIIMIGEMRDRETASIAVQSALTGHLVLSTLHTNDSASGVTRLMDMGVEDYLLTSTVNGILAQRLVRTLCSHCREPYDALPEVIEDMGLRRYVPQGPVRLYRAVGCDACNGIGFLGRMSIMEFLLMSDSIRRLVLQHADAGKLYRQAQQEGMWSMYEDGLCKAVAGGTTVEEVLRVTQES